MSQGNELWLTEKWISDTLKAGTALCSLLAGGTAAPCIHSEYVPMGSALPGVIISLSMAEEMGAVTGKADTVHITARVKAVVQDTSYGLAGTVAQQVNLLLGGVSGTLTINGGTVLYVNSCIRKSPFQMVENTDGKQYRHLGADYSLWVGSP